MVVEEVPKRRDLIELIRQALRKPGEGPDAERDDKPLFDSTGPQGSQGQQAVKLFNELMTVTHTAYQAMTAMQLPSVMQQLIHGHDSSSANAEMRLPEQYKINGVTATGE